MVCLSMVAQPLRRYNSVAIDLRDRVLALDLFHGHLHLSMLFQVFELRGLAVERDLRILGNVEGGLLRVGPDHHQLAVRHLDHVALVDGVLLVVRASQQVRPDRGRPGPRRADRP